MTLSSNNRNSEAFGEGYGDFIIESSDGIFFHVSSFLLGYISPVFRDMFSLGSEKHEGIYLYLIITIPDTNEHL
jgi:hypothetical protein